MHRRTFCKSTLGAAVVTILPGCSPEAPPTGSGAARFPAVSVEGESISIEAAAISELADELRGRLLLPADPDYAVAHRIWNGMFDDRQPAMVVQCTHAEDVIHAVTFAKERNLLLAVRGGGHSLPGKSTCDGGMMIDLSQMHRVDVDAEARTAKVQGGALLGHLDGAAMERGLLTTTGVVSHTGVGGFTLGGGMGRTDRLMGLAIDNLLQATIVTAGGDVLTASEDEDPDLFWAIRGGGGNFGVATEFVYRLHPFDPMPYGGTLEWDIGRARDLLRLYAEVNHTLPDEANVEPYLAPGQDGGQVVGIEFVFAGDHDVAARVFAPFVDFGDRLSGELGPVSYAALQTQQDGFFNHGRQFYLKSGFVPELTESAIDAIVGEYPQDAPFGAWFQHLGGAVSRAAADSTAYAHREASFNFGISSVWDDPAIGEERIAAVRSYYRAVEPFMGGFYTNLNDDTEQKTWGNYGPAYPRLVEIKNKYDPTNLFRLNANIKPTV